MSDIRVSAARDFHMRAAEAENQASVYRGRRNRLILELRAEDPAHWTYVRLAVALHCPAALIATVVRDSRKAS